VGDGHVDGAGVAQGNPFFEDIVEAGSKRVLLHLFSLPDG
jgi:hypothetical protein